MATNVRSVGKAFGLFPHWQSQKRSVLANSASLIVNTFAGSFFGFVFWLIAARTYPQAEVGLGAAFISALTFLTTLGELGLGTALIRFAPTLGAQQARFVNSVLVAVGIATAGVALIFALGTPLWSPDMAALAHSGLYLGLFVGTALVFGLAQVLDRLFIAFGVTHFMLGRNLLANVVRLALVLTVSQWGGAIGLLGAVGGAALLTFGLAALVFAPRALPGYRVRPAFDWPLLRDKLGYTLGNHFAALLWNAPALLYPLLIVALLGTAANAHFYISWMIANLLFIIPTAISTSAFARASQEGHFRLSPFWRTMLLTLAGLVPLAGVLIVAAPLVLGAFGRDYGAGGQEVFTWLVLSVFPYTVNTCIITYHRIQQNVGRVVLVSAATTLLCLGGSLAGGAEAGLPGIGLGWLGGQVLGVILAVTSRGLGPSRATVRHLVVGQLPRLQALPTHTVFWLYLGLIAGAELLTAAINPEWGLFAHIGLLGALLIHGGLTHETARRRLLLSLTLAPLIRLLSLALPLTEFPQQAWYPLVAIPLFVALGIIVRQLGITRADLGLRRVPLGWQLLIMGGGLGLGAFEYSILRPRPLLTDLGNWRDLILAALILVIFTGLMEEIIFRGLLQSMAGLALGRWGLLYVALLFGALHIGYLSVADVIFVTAVGVAFGLIVRWSGSILGVTLAHGLTNITLFLIMPTLTRAAPSAASTLTWLVIGVGAVLALAACAWLWHAARPAPSRPPVPAIATAVPPAASVVPAFAEMGLAAPTRAPMVTAVVAAAVLPAAPPLTPGIPLKEAHKVPFTDEIILIHDVAQAQQVWESWRSNLFSSLLTAREREQRG